MAFSEIELKRIDATVGELRRRSSPPQYADQLRFTYDIDSHSVSIFEERPPWDGRPGTWTRHGVARFRYFRSRGQWQLYWMRADLKWHVFEPVSPAPDLSPTTRSQVVAQRFGPKSSDQEEVGSHPAAPPSPISLLVASSALS
jgi:Protein of unknown function (DUF3024)